MLLPFTKSIKSFRSSYLFLCIKYYYVNYYYDYDYYYYYYYYYYYC